MPKKPRLAGMSLVPAAARPPARPSSIRTTHDVPEAIREAIHAFETAVGGRAALIEFLSSGDSDESVDAVLSILGQPRFDDTPLAKICAQAGISPGQLFAAFDRASLVRAQILGRLEASKAAPAVTKEVARTALPHEQVCSACNGVGSFERMKDVNGKREYVTEVCASCNGVGTVKRDGDPDQQKTILEMTGLLKSSGGTQISQNLNLLTPAVAVTGGSLEQLQQVVSDLIYRTPAPAPSITVEADVVSSPTQDDRTDRSP